MEVFGGVDTGGCYYSIVSRKSEKIGREWEKVHTYDRSQLAVVVDYAGFERR